MLDEVTLAYPASKDLIVSISRKNKAGHMFRSAAVHCDVAGSPFWESDVDFAGSER